MLFFMMLHKEKEISGLSGTLDLRCLPPVLDLRKAHEILSVKINKQTFV